MNNLHNQPTDVQDCVAQLVTDWLADEAQWAHTFASKPSQDWLDQQAQIVRQAIKAGDVQDFDPNRL